MTAGHAHGSQGTDHGPLPAALADLLGPDLPGAACAGRPGLFDPPAPGEDPDDLAYRRTAAHTVCASCPVLLACSRSVDEFAELRGSNGFVLGARIVRSRKQ